MQRCTAQGTRESGSVAVKLEGQQDLPWETPTPCPAGFETETVTIGKDPAQMGVEIAQASWTHAGAPTQAAMSRLHAARLGKRICPVVVVARRTTDAWLFGPVPDSQVIGPLPVDQALRMVQSALEQPSGLLARQRLASLYEAVASTGLPGVANGGLFATNDLDRGVRRRPDWSGACESAKSLLALRREKLLGALGFVSEPIGGNAAMLRTAGEVPRAVAVLLTDDETFDANSKRFAVSPVSFGLKVASTQHVPWLIVARGSQLRLYPARPDVGVGRKGQAETYFELDLALLTDDTAGFLPLVFSGAALDEGGTAEALLGSSAQYAVALSERLRSKVYDAIVPKLSLAIAEQLPVLGYDSTGPGSTSPTSSPCGSSSACCSRPTPRIASSCPTARTPATTATLSTPLLTTSPRTPTSPSTPSRRRSGTTLPRSGGSSTRATTHGRSRPTTAASSPAIPTCIPKVRSSTGSRHQRRDGPRAAGDARRHRRDRHHRPDRLPFAERPRVRHHLRGPARVEPRARRRRPHPRQERHLAASRPDDEVVAPAGTVYFHNTSGQRKGTGSYFTPSFVVEHLLERALDPALDEHLARIADRLDATTPPARPSLLRLPGRRPRHGLGSLPHRCDRPPRGEMAAFLADHDIPGVTHELRHLEAAARDAAGPDAPAPEPSSLLRRQIARRCIYGLDINPVAVELARVSIWIHTFVRGLPMSSLDHNLVCANSLTGIGSVDEALDVLVDGRKGNHSRSSTPRSRRRLTLRVTCSPTSPLQPRPPARRLKPPRAPPSAPALRPSRPPPVRCRGAQRPIGRSDLVAAKEPDKIAALADQDPPRPR